ncbi:hypothetical protein BX616_004522 [Lobosporangium transversale]|uniref:Alpha/Beta hydrolase protein n=1 Tax=Lobosporangium transversale TaxID=64571 RepID=A0A1Y2GHZ8_9FUNG|nr:hypothetical protein BCR41DRAFT_387833 [Lobosporangium transversale]KAF9916140.1 hypothetical protein BX616_004522 [Lobosporangium transversale]ORZ11398.1 hypothetical protein BCR41DRAFT_387833 [Lobosporangium transversale]|eukprot:XP_021879713.1 hypothetical protein BCR41DRAFT_387833 [Lobosporangium transversale]
MLKLLTPRVASQVRHFLRINATTAHSARAFPRHPVFFSTTAKHWSSTPPLTPPLQKESTDNSTQNTSQLQSKLEYPSPTPTNLDNPPESVSCTVSPPSTYAFLKPTPVVLLTGPFGGNWCFRDTWQASLADQGYQSTSIEMSMPIEPLDSGDAYIRHFVKVLKKSIETDHSFYPPILIAHGLHALVAYKYVESNPVSALVLVSPFIPDLIKHRFKQLSYKLKIEKTTNTTATAAIFIKHSGNGQEAGESSEGSATITAPSASSRPTISPKVSTSIQVPIPTPVAAPLPEPSAEELTEFDFDTHADVVAQVGFRERFVLPKKAVYKIDQVAKELQEKEKEKEKEKTKEYPQEIDGEGTGISSTATGAIEKVISSKSGSGISTEDLSSPSKTSLDSTVQTAEINEKGPSSSFMEDTGFSKTGNREDKGIEGEGDEDILPIQTVESEGSIPSSLESLPLTIYDSISLGLFEPNFPILLVTSNGDEIVSTSDVKTHHVLSGQVDHIELEDLDDGGHLIMVSDNTEWEQGIQGITAWLDSNGM